MDCGKRADYLREHKVFRKVGKNCTVVERKVPICPNLISLGDNVHLAAGVLFAPHDAIYILLNGMYRNTGAKKYKEKLGCIELGNNVFVGARATILYDVKIGSNVIIGAGSLVNKDIPDNSVACGVPARVVGTFDDFVKKYRAGTAYPDALAPVAHYVTKELEEWLWADFKNRH